MFKFLRKYNKYILAVGGTLLLITFLIPFAFTNLLQGVGRGGATWATINDDRPEKVTVSDLARIQRELQLLQFMAPQLALQGIDRAEYWYLLQREAAQGGFVTAAGTALQGQLDPQTLALLSGASGENVQFVAQTMAKVQGVGRMLQAYLGSDRYSDRRLKHRAQRMFHRATILPVVLEASAPHAPATYTDEQLLEQMNKYAEDAPGAGEMGFGYRLPNRAKLEWLVISAASVEAMIEATGQLDPVALRKHWRREYEADLAKNIDPRFGPPDANAPVPDAVRSDLLSTLTRGKLDEIARYANDQLRIARRGLAHRGGYQELPDGWHGLGFEDLALDIQESFGVALPEYHALGDRWLTADDLAELNGIGTASTQKFGQTPVGLAQLVMAAKAFGGSPTIPIQQDVAGPPLRGGDESVYLFRIIATDPSRPPEAVDEVRDALVADLNKLAHYRQLVDAADSIRQIAIDQGLVALAMAYDTTLSAEVPASLIDTRTLFGQNVPMPTPLPVIGPHEETVAAIIDRAMSLPKELAVKDAPLED
ncbi:MAG: SurA N-terminal domain-containing protein, partial [Planctomycetota bacterium]